MHVARHTFLRFEYREEDIDSLLENVDQQAHALQGAVSAHSKDGCNPVLYFLDDIDGGILSNQG